MTNPSRSTASRQRAFVTGVLVVWLVLALVWVGYVPLLRGLPVAASRAAVLVVFTVASWALGLLPEPNTTLMFFLFAMLFHVAPPVTVFSGFASPAWWLVFGGAVAGIAIRTTGLGSRLGRFLFAHSAGSYGHAVTVMALASVALAFVMPSTTGRVLLLTPIALALSDRLGFVPGRAGRTGLVMVVAAASYMPSTAILPANVPNSVLLGAADTLYGIKLQYGSYFLLHFPVLGALKTVVLVWLICRLFSDHAAPPMTLEPPPQKLSTRERRLTIILALALVLYATDFLHGISPAWVTLAAATACLLPAADIVTGKDFTEQLHITPLIYVAGFLGLGAVIAESGLGAWASHGLLGWVNLDAAHPLGNLSLLAGIDACIGLLTTLPGLPAVLTPLAQAFSRASGLPIYTVLMVQVPVYSTVFLPYQSPPMMIAMHFGGVAMKDGAKLCLALAAVTLAGLLPLDLLWWRWLGVIG